MGIGKLIFRLINGDFMKKIFIGLMMLSSFPAFANVKCKAGPDYDPSTLSLKDGITNNGINVGEEGVDFSVYVNGETGFVEVSATGIQKDTPVVLVEAAMHQGGVMRVSIPGKKSRLQIDCN